MKKLFLLLSSVFFLSAYGQRTCGTNEKMAEFFAANPQAKANREVLKDYLVHNDYKQSKKAGVVTIPVVVHVLYSTAAMNISDAQIASQIKVLNDDFRKLNADFSTVVPAPFQAVAGDMEVQFALANRKPDGSATTGIERKSVASGFNFDSNYYKASGLPSWNTTKYLNIWVGNISAGYLGWAYLPDNAGALDDGLAIGYKFFGTTGTATSPYNKGRTATHEIGHYFGLEHIWGSINGDTDTCGSSTNNDYCADTPTTFEAYYQADTFPSNKYTCSTYVNGAMFMNYMDYVYDNQMAMFSKDQKTILQNTLSGPRASLLTSNGLAVVDFEKSNAISLFPNPAVNYISIASPLVKINEVEIFGNDGKLIKKASLNNETDKIDVKNLPVGTYYVRTYNESGFVKSLKFIKK